MLRVVGGIGSCCPCLLLPPLWNDGSGRLSSWCCADDIVIWVQTEVQTALSFTSCRTHLGLCSAGERYLRVNLKEKTERRGEHTFVACLQTQRTVVSTHVAPC